VGLQEYDELEGIQWEWQAVDGAMTKAPLGKAATGANPTDRGKKGCQVNEVNFSAHVVYYQQDKKEKKWGLTPLPVLARLDEEGCFPALPLVAASEFLG
jgi:hypothetical protein